MFFAMSDGKHPFGERLIRRETNILDNKPDLSALNSDYKTYENLIRSMISYDPNARPTAKDALEGFKSLSKKPGTINSDIHSFYNQYPMYTVLSDPILLLNHS